MDNMPKKVTKTDKKPIKRKEQTRTINNKNSLIKAMIKSLGNITIACQDVKITRETYYGYIKDDPEFKSKIDDIPEIRLDFVENQLNKLIKADHPAAIIFFLKTKGKNRGYVERTEVDTGVDRLTGENFRSAWKESQKKEEPEKPDKDEKKPEKIELGDNLTLYLDIETTGFSRTNDIITVIGIYTETQVIQLVNGINLNEENLSNIIKKAKRIVSFNGILFDIPFIQAKYPGIDFNKVEHKDLRPFCKAHNLTGGLKKIEIELGISRGSGVSDGKEAIVLWDKYKGGCKKSLSKLLEYNKEDIINLSKIEQILESKNK